MSRIRPSVNVTKNPLEDSIGPTHLTSTAKNPSVDYLGAVKHLKDSLTM